MKIKSLLLTLFVWANLLAVLFFAWKWWVQPWMKERAILSTSSGSKYKTKIRIRHDSFSGYAVLRSAKMRELMGANQVGLVFKDDGADYPGRLKALRDGECDLAVFTIDAYLQSGAQAGEFPGSIIAVIDETKGADAIVAFKQAVPDIRALNKKDARFLLTEGSPSEFLARVVVSNFMLPDLPKQWITGKAGAKDVFAAMKFADRKSPQAFVLWEPYVSRALQIDGVHKVLGTEKLQGYILDVIVASREFLRQDEALAVKTLEAYFRALYHYGNRSEGMRELLAEDAKEYGEAIDPAQAAAIEEGIQFKNTAANWQHFGLAQAGKGMYLEDVIDNIGRVLTQTGSISANPVDGKAGSIFYDAPLKALQAKGFHPGRLDDGPLAAGGPGDASSLPEERAAASAELPAIDDGEAAKRLRVVGDIRLAPIMFARGRSEINVFSNRELDQLSRRLINFPGYYLRIEGHFRLAGDAAANRGLARERARAVTQRLVAQGVPANRLITSEDASDLLGSEGQSVSFSFMERPF